jgi:putative sigma-54 modulation protein
MNVTITGRHAEMSDVVRDYAQGKAEWLGRHFDFLTDLRITLNVDGKRHAAEIIAFSRKGERVVAAADGDDLYQTVDLAAERMMHQLRKFKEKIRTHRVPGPGKGPL